MAEFNIDPTVFVDYELRTRLLNPPTLRLEVRPFANKERLDFGREMLADERDEAKMTREEIWTAFEKFVPVVMERIVGWDLTIKGEPIKCDAAAKETYLRPLLWESVVAEKKAEPVGYDPGDPEEEAKKPGLDFLWAKVLKVIGDKESVLKN